VSLHESLDTAELWWSRKGMQGSHLFTASPLPLQAAKKKTASTMKTLKERFKKLFVPNKTKTKSTREGSAPGPATPDEDAPVPSAPPMPTT
jgi:hypothetical protein